MKNNELLEALTILEREKNISKSTLLEAIESSLLIACKNHFGKADNVTVSIDPETCEYHVLAAKTVVEEVTDPVEQISLAEAKDIDGHYEVGDVVQIEIQSKDFGRIATMSAKNTILQKIREEERKAIFNEYYTLEKDIVTGIVQRRVGRNISINLGKADALLTENEQVRGEHLHPNDRVKVYVLEVKEAPKGTRILVSRTHPELVKRLFEEEVSEVRDGIVEIKSIAREAGSRTKMAVWSEDEDVDAVGACVGGNGSRVNAVVSELRGEKIDIIEWNENPAILIEHALSPAKVISVIADGDEKTAKVVVPDYQLSLAIGKEGQNARLAARLTGSISRARPRRERPETSSITRTITMSTMTSIMTTSTRTILTRRTPIRMKSMTTSPTMTASTTATRKARRNMPGMSRRRMPRMSARRA